MEGIFLKFTNNVYRKLVADITLNRGTSTLKSETRRVIPAEAIRQKNKFKCIKIGKEETKLLLFIDDMTIHVENPKELNRKNQSNNS
jgi:hypothetical protein